MSAALQQNNPPEHTATDAATLRLTITGEAIAYICIGIVAALLRLIHLGAMPLSDAESYHALSALRTIDSTVQGPALPPASPALFGGQLLSFAILGASDLTARLFVALVGVGLALMPALWRRQLGVLNALGFSTLLALSPTAIAAARTTDGVTITAALAMLAVWLVWRYRAAEAAEAANRTPWAVALGVVVAAMLLLVEPGGPLMALSLAGGLLTVWWTSTSTTQATADGRPPAYGMRDRPNTIEVTLRTFPWKAALLGATVSVVVIATVFMLYPSGLSAVGEVLRGFAEGVFTRPEGGSLAQPVLATPLYEPLAWIFGLLGVFSRDRLGRFLAGWTLTGFFLILLYPGATSSHALLTVVPLAGLAARVLTPRIFGEIDRGGEEDAAAATGWEGVGGDAPGWALWSYVAGLVSLSAAAYLNLMIAGRQIATQIADPRPPLDERDVLSRLLFAGLVAFMITILFFIIGTTWNSRSATRGLLVGLSIVLGAYTLSAGAGLAFHRADDARELWYLSRPSKTIHLLAETVSEGSMRDEGTSTTAPVAAQVPPDGALAWALRDFEALTFIEQPSAAITTPVVVLPEMSGEPTLGADYVGQAFITRRTWSLDSMGPEGLLAWVLQRHTYVAPGAAERYVVWLRTDVYGLVEEGAAEE